MILGPNSDNAEEEDPFDSFLSSQSSFTSTSTSDEIGIKVQGIHKILRDFKGIKRIHYNTNIIQYWKMQENTHSELSKLARIVMAVPATQVSKVFIVEAQ